MQVGHSQSAVQVGQSIAAYTKVPLQTRDTDWLFVRHHMISAWVCHVEKRKKEIKEEEKNNLCLLLSSLETRTYNDEVSM